MANFPSIILKFTFLNLRATRAIAQDCNRSWACTSVSLPVAIICAIIFGSLPIVLLEFSMRMRIIYNLGFLLLLF